MVEKWETFAGFERIIERVCVLIFLRGLDRLKR